MAYGDYLTALLALAFVLGLVALLGWGVRRFRLIPGVAPGRRDGRRLSVVEVATVDVRRRLVLVRRDDVEHLILLGAAQDVLVETGIPAAAGSTHGPGATGR